MSRLPPGVRLRDPAALVATWFGAGLLPGAPGTWGSLAALPLGWLALVHGGTPAVIGVAAVVFFAGLWASGVVLAHARAKDPGIVVVDEAAGQVLALAAAPPEPVFLALAFALFRFFDIVKPWPISWADRRVPGALGVMVDDVLAGLAAALVLSVAAPYATEVLP